MVKSDRSECFTPAENKACFVLNVRQAGLDAAHHMPIPTTGHPNTGHTRKSGLKWSTRLTQESAQAEQRAVRTALEDAAAAAQAAQVPSVP